MEQNWNTNSGLLLSAIGGLAIGFLFLIRYMKSNRRDREDRPPCATPPPPKESQDGDNPLLKACEAGQLDLAKDLAKRFSPRESTAQGWNALHLAVRGGCAPLCEFLIPMVDVNSTNANGWTALHVAAAITSSGPASPELLQIVKVLLSSHVNVNHQDAMGHTALYIAACNGDAQFVRLLLDAGADATLSTLQTQRSPLLIAASNAREDVFELLMQQPPHVVEKLVAQADTQGTTPLIAAMKFASDRLIAALLAHPAANVRAVRSDGATALHVAAANGNLRAVQRLLQASADMSTKNRFGATAVHTAASSARLDILKLLIAAGADVYVRDNDGLTALHTVVNFMRKQPLARARELVEFLAPRLASEVDYSGSTALHLLCMGSFPKPEGAPARPTENSDSEVELPPGWDVEVARILLDSGADVTMENCLGMTPVHLAAQHLLSTHHTRTATTTNTSTTIASSATTAAPATTTPPTVPITCPPLSDSPLLQLLLARCPEAFRASFNPCKERNANGVRRVFHPLPLHERLAVLGLQDAREQPTVAHFARRLASARPRSVIVMTGAGISVSAGIPDFRSPGSGIWTETGSSSSVFDRASYLRDPSPFLDLARRCFLPIFDGQVVPTDSHRFILFLEQRGLLLRNYTQNIDMLEHKVGLPAKRVVEAHGSFATAHCLNPLCGIEAPISIFTEALKDRTGSTRPLCPSCGGLVRPDIVGFGDPLTLRYTKKYRKDFARCDVLIVMGTSLVVFPFAGLANEVRGTVPRLLINREPVGPWRGGRWDEDTGARNTVASPDDPLGHFVDFNYRDVRALGECDVVCRDIQQLLVQAL